LDDEQGFHISFWITELGVTLATELTSKAFSRRGIKLRLGKMTTVVILQFHFYYIQKHKVIVKSSSKLVVSGLGGHWIRINYSVDILPYLVAIKNVPFAFSLYKYLDLRPAVKPCKRSPFFCLQRPEQITHGMLYYFYF
jgi:hypothetical protein